MSITITKGNKTAVIFGGRSWLGHHLTTDLEAKGYSVHCSTSNANQNTLNTNSGTIYSQVVSPEQAEALVKRLEPALVFNLLIGIDDLHAAMHASIVKVCTELQSHLVFTSSAMALDGYDVDTPLTDKLGCKSISPYGSFKGACETLLLETPKLSSMIVRFSSIHGWGPWKDSRTVALLKRVHAGERVVVDRGVIQNRLTDRALSTAIVTLAERRRTGIAHFGTQDSSEELDFLRRLAQQFGYSGETINAGQQREVNLAVVPSDDAFDTSPPSEADTLSALRQSPELNSLAQM